VRDGLTELLGPGIEVIHAQGPDPNPEREVFASSTFESDRGNGLWGEYYNNDQLDGEPVLQRLDERLNFTWGQSLPIPEITRHEYSIRWTGALRPTESGRHAFYSRSHNSLYRIWLDGEVVFDTWNMERNGPHKFELQLEAGRRYALKIEWRKTRYSGALQFGWHHYDGGLHATERAVAVAKQADVAVVCVGFDQVSEGEGFDRPFAMNPVLETLVKSVAAVQPNTVVVLTAGGNVDMNGWLDSVRGLVHAWYPGQAGGQAVAEVLLGHVNPSGKLPATFERQLENRSSFDSYHDVDGALRVSLSDGLYSGYRHFDAREIAPRFPFGFGLSYTQFALSELSLSAQHLPEGGELAISLDVENTGERRGAEVVQLYVRQTGCPLTRPGKQLLGFSRVELDPGERRRVSIVLTAKSLEAYDPERHAWVHQAGRCQALVGTSCTDIRLKADFTTT
jgi:beta-glucosidase